MRSRKQGFTLIELSIVLVIIGLIIGGILTGRDLIQASTIRAQISQIEKYNQAVNTFYGKYGALPGDIPEPGASSFGFTSRGTGNGEGDGNGLIQGNDGTGGGGVVYGYLMQGETSLFWRDMSNAGLIAGTFNGLNGAWGQMTTSPITSTTTPSLASAMPVAVIGSDNYIGVYNQADGKNYFFIQKIPAMTYKGYITGQPALTVAQAYALDGKIDDGTAIGRVIAWYINTSYGTAPSGNPDTATTCFNTVTLQYSMQQNYGSGLNCELSIRIQ